MTQHIESTERLRESNPGRLRRIPLVVLAGVMVLAMVTGAIFLVQAKKSKISVLNAVGMTEATAQQVLSKSGLTTVVVSLGRGTAHPPPPGTVVAEMPKAGAVVSNGSRVQINVYLATNNTPLKTGAVVGTFRLNGGPGPGESMPVRGTVIFTPLKDNQGTSVRVTVSATGRFIAHIPMGSWKVTASSPQFNSNQRGGCGAVHPITVKVGENTTVAVQCTVK